MRLLVFSFALLGLLFSLPVSANTSDDDTGIDDRQVFHLYNNLDLVSTIKIQYDKPRIVVKSVFPQLEGDNPSDFDSDSTETDIETINSQISDLVQEAISEFKDYVNQNIDLQKDLARKKVRNNFYLDYSASFIRLRSTPILSIRFNTQGMVTGMAHPYHRHFVLNYDLKNDEELSLDDLFNPGSDYLRLLSEYANTRLSKRLQENQLIAKGIEPNEDNFKNWNIKTNGLLFTFDEGQVAPYYLGAQTILVPYSILKEVIATSSPIAKCGSKKSCGSDLLLTGGFIDEADNSSTIKTRHRHLNPILSQR